MTINQREYKCAKMSQNKSKQDQRSQKRVKPCQNESKRIKMSQNESKCVKRTQTKSNVLKVSLSLDYLDVKAPQLINCTPNSSPWIHIIMQEIKEKCL